MLLIGFDRPKLPKPKLPNDESKKRGMDTMRSLESPIAGTLVLFFTFTSLSVDQEVKSTSVTKSIEKESRSTTTITCVQVQNWNYSSLSVPTLQIPQTPPQSHKNEALKPKTSNLSPTPKGSLSTAAPSHTSGHQCPDQ